MIIQLKAAEGGKVTHEKQPGSIINQGDLLASLELKDPSKVKKILSSMGSSRTRAPPTRRTPSCRRSARRAASSSS